MPCSAVSSSAAGIERNISFTSSASSTVFCSLTRTPAVVKVRATHRASFLPWLRAMYLPRANRATMMLMVERLTPKCSASFDRVVGRVACK